MENDRRSFVIDIKMLVTTLNIFKSANFEVENKVRSYGFNLELLCSGRFVQIQLFNYLITKLITPKSIFTILQLPKVGSVNVILMYNFTKQKLHHTQHSICTLIFILDHLKTFVFYSGFIVCNRNTW